MTIYKSLLVGTAALAVTTSAALAQTEINWWHAMGGTNGERVDKIAADFNASQSEYKVVPTYKGNYTETMTSAVAAFRAGEQPHLVQVFEVGTATMMAAEGAIYPVEQMMEDAGEAFDGCFRVGLDRNPQYRLTRLLFRRSRFKWHAGSRSQALDARCAQSMVGLLHAINDDFTHPPCLADGIATKNGE